MINVILVLNKGNYDFLGFARDSHPCLCISLWPLNTRVSHFPQPGNPDHAGDLMSTFTRYFTLLLRLYQ